VIHFHQRSDLQSNRFSILNIRIILADNVRSTQAKYTKIDTASIDGPLTCVKYIDGQFIMILPIGGFQFEIFPAILSNFEKEAFKNGAFKNGAFKSERTLLNSYGFFNRQGSGMSMGVRRR
jgi:hypothetical protein